MLTLIRIGSGLEIEMRILSTMLHTGMFSLQK